MAPGKYGLKVTANSVEGSLSRTLLNELEQNKLYLDVEFNRNDLARKLELSEERISALLNKELGISFYELINKYRVKEAKLLLDQGVSENLTMEAIAKQSGFKSKTTFYKFFKSEFGMRPSDYIKSHSTH